MNRTEREAVQPESRSPSPTPRTPAPAVRVPAAPPRPPRVLAVASGGGHWVELLRLLPAIDLCDVAFATVRKEYQEDVPGRRFYVVRDATRWNKLALLLLTFRLLRIFLKERPELVISTGAAPGLLALIIARWFRIKTAWIDSIANADELSLSGQRAGKYADLWLTQWAHLARPGGPHYKGAVL